MENEAVTVKIFGREVGKLAAEPDNDRVIFQYRDGYFRDLPNIFPFVIKKTDRPQMFKGAENRPFRGLPSVIADSLPDDFGNMLFNDWLKRRGKEPGSLSPLEQLTYISDRGMGALEYYPAKDIPEAGSMKLEEIIGILDRVILSKREGTQPDLNEAALFNIFRMGTSAGGARPKLIISRNKVTGEIAPGDIHTSNEWGHYLVKLHLEHVDTDYNRARVEYAYYLLARHCGIKMSPSMMVGEQHFATSRFDRSDGKKRHVLTASGIAGWDFHDPFVSSYTDLFQLAVALKVPHRDIGELFRRMVFNVVMANGDDHLKNHSFIYREESDAWELAPGYDINYPLNALNKYGSVPRALMINRKRRGIERADLMGLAKKYSVKAGERIIDQVIEGAMEWERFADEALVPEKVAMAIQGDHDYLESD